MTEKDTQPKPRLFEERHEVPKEGPRTISPLAFRSAVAKALADRAYECDGNCELDERACWDAHPITWTATLNGEVHFGAGVNAVADVAFKVACDLGLLT
jgi:hypothetical protein